MDSSKTKIILHYKYLAKKYKLPYEAADKTVKDLKQEISKRLKAQKVDASPEDFDIEDSNGSILFEEDSVLDLLQNDDELEVKSSHPQNAPILSQPDLSMIIEEFTIQVIPISGQEFTLKTKEEESIAKVLQEICTLEKLDAEQHILTLGLFELDSDKTLKNYNITKGSKLGMKKKQQQQLAFKPLFSQGPSSFSNMFKNSSSDSNLFSSKPVQDSTSLWSSTVQTQKPPAVQQTDDDKFSYLFSLPKQNALNNLLQQHLQLNNLSSSLDASTLNNVSNSNALNSSKSVNNQNISNTGNSLDYVSRYQPSKMQTGLLEKPEEEMVSNFVPESTFKMEEEKKDFIEESDRIVLNYRIIQGRDPEEIKKLAWKKSSNLENLSTHILKINGYKTENFRGALYTEEGIPLSRSLVEMINIKTGDLLRDNDTIYVILASFNVDDTTFPKLNHEEGTEQVFVRSSQTYVVNVDIKTTTVRELKQKIYSKLDIVTSVQALSYGGKPLTDANVLEDYNMHPHSTITLGIRAVASGESYGFTGNFYTPSLVHTKPQSGRGLREFRSHMIALFGQLRDPQLAQKYSVPLLGLIRDLSDNNAPLVNALYVLLGNGSLKLTHKIALEEGMLNLFSKLVLRSSERPKGFESFPEEVFEHTRPILSALISFINALPNVPQVWSDRESFKAAETQCQLTFQILRKPAHLKFDDGSKKICERTAVEKKIAAGEKIAGIAELTLDKIEELPEVQRQVDLLRACHVNEMDIWTPKDKNMTKFEQSNKFNLTNWEALCNQADKIPFLKIYKSLELKNNAPAYCLTLNSRGKLILYMGKNKDVSKPIDTYDAITGATENINADDVASQLAAQANQIKIEKSITRPPKEAIMVLLDVSGSMKKDYFDSVSMMRIGAVKAFFNAFADRTMAYDFHHVVSLVFFNSEIKMICDFTEVLNQFKYALDSATPSGTTKLYDSIIYAVEKLNEFKAQYPTSIRRIICLTDGEDYGSKNRAWRAARMVQDAGIVLDSFVVGPECEGLKTITFATGGFCYCPQEINEAMRLFEGETILRAGIREKRASQELVTSENDLTALKNRSFTTELIPMQLPEKINEPVVKPKALIQHIAASQAQILGVSPPRRLKRIVKEIYHYTSNPHPYIQIFPGKEDITFWKILLKGPEKTPYENGTFILYANFPEKYPNEAPNIRFLTEIYHCNINSNGRICHSVFDRNYTIDTTIKVIFDCIYGLLLTPEPEDPLDNTLATEFLSERPKYEENARKLTKSKATKDNDALMLEFLGAEMNSGLQDEELLAKMKEFEDWLNK